MLQILLTTCIKAGICTKFPYLESMHIMLSCPKTKYIYRIHSSSSPYWLQIYKYLLLPWVCWKQNFHLWLIAWVFGGRWLFLSSLSRCSAENKQTYTYESFSGVQSPWQSQGNRVNKTCPVPPCCQTQSQEWGFDLSFPRGSGLRHRTNPWDMNLVYGLCGSKMFMIPHNFGPILLELILSQKICAHG